MNRIWSSVKSHPYIINIVGYTTLFATADVIQQSTLGQKEEKNHLCNVATLENEKPRKCEGRATDEGGNLTSQMESSLKMPKKPVELQAPVQIRTKPSDYGKVGLDFQVTEPSPPTKEGTWSTLNWSQTARVALVGFCFHANFNYHWLKGLEKMWPGGGAKRIIWKVFLDQIIAAPITISVFYIGLSTLERRQDIFEDWKEKFWTSYKAGVVYWSAMQTVNFLLVPPVARTVFVGGIALGWTVFLCHLRQQRG